MQKKGKILRTVLIAVILVSLFFIILNLLQQDKKAKEVPLLGRSTTEKKVTTFEEFYAKGKIAGAYVGGNYVRFYLTEDGVKEYNNSLPADAKKLPRIDEQLFNKGYAHFSASIASVGIFDNAYSRMREEIRNEGGKKATVPEVAIKYDNPESRQRWTSYIVPIMSLGILIVFGFLIFKQASGTGSGVAAFTKSKAKLMTNVKTKFSDVAGAEEEKEELQEIVEFLRAPKKYEKTGARFPKGILLVGPPGTGKTLFAKAVAGEAGVPFFSVSGSDFVEMFVGAGAARIRSLFEEAKRNKPCIVFIDEIDAVGRQRGAGLGGGNDEKEQTLNQLLVLMDGFDENEGIVILAATNRVDVLDPALIRAGRFDKHIQVNPPDVKGREDILKIHARNKPISNRVSFKVLARMTSGFTGADIENLMNIAAMRAAKANRNEIIMLDILEGINSVIIGPQKKSRVVTEKDKNITAYHECGHAIVSKILEHCDEVQEVSIIPRGYAAGYTLTREVNDDAHVSYNKLNDIIAMTLGGRAAEYIFIKDITTGASSDIERATTIARKMVTEWGMSSKIGNMNLGGGQEVFLGRDYAVHNNSSEGMNYIVDQEIKEILEQNYKRALEIVDKNKQVIENMVKVLFVKSTIYTAEVDMLLNGATAEEVITFIDKQEEQYGKDVPRVEELKDVIMQESEEIGIKNSVEKTVSDISTEQVDITLDKKELEQLEDVINIINKEEKNKKDNDDLIFKKIDEDTKKPVTRKKSSKKSDDKK